MRQNKDDPASICTLTRMAPTQGLFGMRPIPSLAEQSGEESPHSKAGCARDRATGEAHRAKRLGSAAILCRFGLVATRGRESPEQIPPPHTMARGPPHLGACAGEIPANAGGSRSGGQTRAGTEARRIIRGEKKGPRKAAARGAAQKKTDVLAGAGLFRGGNWSSWRRRRLRSRC